MGPKVREGLFEAVIAEFDVALLLFSDSADAYYFRWRALFQLGSLVASVADGEELLLVVPDHPEVYYSRGKPQWYWERHAEAIAGLGRRYRFNALLFGLVSIGPAPMPRLNLTSQPS